MSSKGLRDEECRKERNLRSGAGNDSAGSGEAPSVEVENRVADGFTVSGQFTGSELGEVVLR